MNDYTFRSFIEQQYLLKETMPNSSKDQRDLEVAFSILDSEKYYGQHESYQSFVQWALNRITTLWLMPQFSQENDGGSEQTEL